MRVIMQIPLQSISNPKKPAFDRKTLRFVFALMRGEKFPPIPVERIGAGTYTLKGGRHRWSAYKLLGRKSVLASVGIPQDPNPYKDLRHAPAKRVRSSSNEPMEKQTWLEQ